MRVLREPVGSNLLETGNNRLRLPTDLNRFFFGYGEENYGNGLCMRQ